ncbi:hypothetical protein AVEN_10020-1 [Araneus ventricosus]|uniref:Reverse transcriptase zinc-binding domain-containing protein n=1 Tax=Araneus ventricosus TaxID=182803 RepID=A0A4Y2H2B4_ARAVE|nr:hypothetical protein AVEN_10020-1 [Araneus ventricosus]
MPSPPNSSNNEWKNGDTERIVNLILSFPSPWKRQDILFATGDGPFATYPKRFNSRKSDRCDRGELGSPQHFATSCPLTNSFHLTKLSNDLEQLWWRIVLTNPFSRIKIRKLIKFISKNKDIRFSPN